MSTCVYRAETGKSVTAFVTDFSATITARGFSVHNEDKMEMARIFGAHGAEVAEGFDLHMIQICKPDKAAKSLSANPERAVLMPKFVMCFSKNGKTQVRMLKFGRDLIAELVDDAEFPASLEETFKTLIEAIDVSL